MKRYQFQNYQTVKIAIVKWDKDTSSRTAYGVGLMDVAIPATCKGKTNEREYYVILKGDG